MTTTSGELIHTLSQMAWNTRGTETTYKKALESRDTNYVANKLNKLNKGRHQEVGVGNKTLPT